MRKISLKKILLVILLITVPLSKAISGNIKCLSPQETVTQFYRWYLGEIKDEKYPLIQDYIGDRSNLDDSVSASLLSKLREEELSNEMDYDYFTCAQDFFEEWLTHIHVRTISQSKEKSGVQLSLGEKDTLHTYKVDLIREHCWKINSVRHVD